MNLTKDALEHMTGLAMQKAAEVGRLEYYVETLLKIIEEGSPELTKEFNYTYIKREYEKYNE